MALRTSSSKGASGISSDPRTPPLFFIAVRTSSSLSSLRQSCYITRMPCTDAVAAQCLTSIMNGASRLAWRPLPCISFRRLCWRDT